MRARSSEPAARNDPLPLGDRLAVDRTVLANERTFLAYIRTALGFLVLGVAFLHFLAANVFQIAAGVFFALGSLVLLIGIVRFLSMRKELNQWRPLPGEQVQDERRDANES